MSEDGRPADRGPNVSEWTRPGWQRVPARAFDQTARLYWPAQRITWRVRRAWFISRVEALSRAVGSRVEMRLAPDVQLGRRITVVVQPNTHNLLSIGAETSIGDDAVLHFLGGSVRFGSRDIVRKGFRCDSSGELVIGDGVFIGYGVFLHCAISTSVADLAVLAEYVTVTDSAHVRGAIDIPAFDHVRTAPTRIGRNTWLGAHVVAAAGVTIGDGAFVGANAVVTDDVPAGYLAAGNPARVIKELAVETIDD